MNTAELLERVRQLGKLPTDAEDWPDSQILLEATNALYTRFSQPIQNLGESWWAQSWVFPAVPGEDDYRLPPRCLANSFIQFEASADGGHRWRPMKIVTPGRAGAYESSSGGPPMFFSYSGGYLKVYPTPNSPEQMFRLTANLRPSKLIAPSALGKVTAVNYASQQIDMEGDPSALLTMTSSTLDVVNVDGSCEVVTADLPYVAISFIGGTAYRVQGTTSADVSKVRIGQVLRPSDQSDQIPLPVELHHALACYTAAVILIANGDDERAAPLASKADKDITRFVDVVTPRGKTHPFKFSSRNSWLRRNVPRRF